MPRRSNRGRGAKRPPRAATVHSSVAALRGEEGDIGTIRQEPRSRASWLQGSWWLHPLLLGAFPVLFLFADNLGEQVTIEPLIGPLVVAVAGSATFLLVVVALCGALGIAPMRSALVASAGIALFFGYGHVAEAIPATVPAPWPLLGAWAVLAVAGIAFGTRTRSERVQKVTGVLNLAAAILVAINLVPIAGFVLQADPVAAGGRGSGDAPPPNASDPDIWYLVFDRYGGERGLSAAYGFDNGAFIAALEARGFTVYDGATANYLKTAHSLASTLEMAYLDGDALRDAATASDDYAPLYRVLQGSHAVERFLHDRGYQYLHLGVRRGSTYTNTTADRTFLYTDQTEFSAVLLETTLLAALDHLGGSDALGGTAALYRSQSLYQLNMLDQLASADPERPRFIFAHVLLPHPPYVFNADGSWVTAAQAGSRSPDQHYLEQLQFANVRILELLDNIQRSSGEEPVIILQADEGPFPERYARDEWSFAWREATDAELVQKFSILAAYRVPSTQPRDVGLPSTTTPVNTFRAVFNAVFDAGFELLPDRNVIFTDQRHLYDLVDATARVRDALEAAR